MSGTWYREGRLPVVLLAALFALTLGSDAAWPAVGGSHGGGHIGGFGGGRFVGRRFGDHRFARGRHGRRGFLGDFAYPYDDEYDLDYGYDPHYSYPSGYPDGGHCDVSSHTYPQYCVWKDGL